MLRLSGGQVESLWDEVLPVGVRELPADLAALDVLLRDRALLAPIAAHWESEAAAGRASVGHGRPTIAMETYVRLSLWQRPGRRMCIPPGAVSAAAGGPRLRNRRGGGHLLGFVSGVQPVG